MPKFRVEVTETTTVVTEKWFEATDADDARRQAEGEDWRAEGWQEVSAATDCGVTDVELVEYVPAVAA